MLPIKDPYFWVEHTKIRLKMEGQCDFHNCLSLKNLMVVSTSRISIHAGVKVSFEYASGKGPQSMNIETSFRLDDNLWHSVLVERNQKEAVLIVDKLQKGQIKEPLGPFFPLVLTSNLFIGANKDYTTGFVGCIRALVINGVSIDLMEEVTKNSQTLYGVSVGCTGKCNKNLCKNEGICKESYNDYTCDCSQTVFKGHSCTDEVGVSMKSNSFVKYDFEKNIKTTLDEKIHIAFSTTNPNGLLLGVFSDLYQEFFVIRLTKIGHLQVVFDFGFGKQEVELKEEGSLLTGQIHDVQIRRIDKGRQISIVLDNYEAKIFSFYSHLNSSTNLHQKSYRYLYLGKTETMEEGFTGCISRVEFNDVKPLKLLFQENPPSNVKATPENIKEDNCGIDPVTPIPKETETRQTKSFREEKVSNDHFQTFHSVIFCMLFSLIFLVAFLTTVFIKKYKNRHKGAYLTREDEGAQDAYDADTAVLQGKTGCQVEKKKEWFI